MCFTILNHMKLKYIFTTTFRLKPYKNRDFKNEKYNILHNILLQKIFIHILHFYLLKYNMYICLQNNLL